MKYLNSYLDFLLESKSEDKLKIVYSVKFKSILINIDSFISNKLLQLSFPFSRNVYEQTLIDVTDKNDSISFIQSNRISNSKEYEDYLKANIDANPGIDPDKIIAAHKNDVPSEVSDKDSKFWKSSRNSMSIGKFTRKILNSTLSLNISDSDLEKFVNDYKREYDEFFSEKVLELVSGEEIRKYYNIDSYEDERGELGNSCMRQPSKSKFFDIYVKNPEVCQLLILRSNKDKSKIKGRSLIWKLNDGSYYQDRIYTINKYEAKLFENWAKEKDMKLYNDDHYDIEVQLGDHVYDYYPYMDTFVCYSPSKKLLSADEDLWPGKGFIKLQDTQGGYENDNVVWSIVENEFIEKDDAKYVKISNEEFDWVKERDVVDLGKRGLWYIDAHPIQWCNYEDDYFHKDDLVYSNYLEEYIYDYVEVKSEGSSGMVSTDYIPKDKKELYSVEIDGELFLKSDLIKDFKTGKLVLKGKIIDDLSKELSKSLTDDKAREIINKSYLNSEYNKDLIKKELSRFGYNFDMMNIDDIITLIYTNMATGYLYSGSYSYQRIISYMRDELGIDMSKNDYFNLKIYWYSIQNVLSNFSYWIFEEDVYHAYLYLNVL